MRRLLATAAALAVLTGCGPTMADLPLPGNGVGGDTVEIEVRFDEALNLSETEAIRLADKIKVFDDKRKPLREQMFESMRVLRAAADGDQAALGKVDQATVALLDLRQQMAVVDKEMFLSVSKDLTPQKRAQLALFLAKFMHERKMGGGMRGGRHHRGGL